MFARLLDVDHFVRAWVVNHRAHLLDGVMVALSAIGRGGMVWLAIGAALTMTRRMKWQRLVELAAAVAVATVAVDYVMKPLVRRDRPFTSIPATVVIDKRPKDASFPSGHAGNAFAAAGVLARAVPALQIAWWTLAALIAYSRVYVGVHYPLDVLAGAALGLGVATALRRLPAALRRSRPARPAG
jgi:undecaprenyl-diphosphatase